MIAEEYNDDKDGFVAFNLTDPVTGSLRKIGPDGTSSGDDSDGIYPTRIETAGLGMSVPLTAPQAYPLPPRRRGYTGDAEGGCVTYVDGIEAARWNCNESDLAGLDGYTWTASTTYHAWGRYGTPSKDPGFLRTTLGTWDLKVTVGSPFGPSLALGALLRSSGDDIYAQLKARRITGDEVKTVKKAISDNLSGDCLGYIYQLMDQVAKNINGEIASKHFSELLDMVNSSTGVTSGPDQSGVWLYMEKSPGATAFSDWTNGNLSVALPASNDSKGIANYLSSSHGVHHLVHELIHVSIKNSGASDIQLAQAALQLSGETLDLSTVADESKTTVASNVWDDRLSQACGWNRRVGMEKYIKKGKTQ